MTEASPPEVAELEDGAARGGGERLKRAITTTILLI